jgi:hypothetical protein
MTMRSLILAMTAFVCGSCQNLECGENTIERDGQCVASTIPSDVECGPGTAFDPGSGRCLSVLTCGENTIAVTTDAGLPVCVGIGGNVDCNQPIPCPSPEGASMTVCGRIYDLEDGTPLDDGNSSNGEPYRDVVIRIYDPLAFATEQTPTVVKTGAPDACGRFAITNVPTSALPSTFIAIVTDDAGSTDNLVQAGIADNAAVGSVLTGLRAWVFRRSTDATWSSQAGLSGDSFGVRGVYVQIFLSGTPLAPFTTGRPTSGVKAAVIGATRDPRPDDDFYFNDTDPVLRHTVSSTRDNTGANGTALLINASLGMYSGVGNEPPSTCWQKTLAASPANSAFIQERIANAESCP